MSDEERKIETLKKYINSQEQKMNDYYKIDEEFYKDEIEQLEFSIKLLRYILNLIEKKSKEIEELKDTRSVFNMGRRSYKNEIEDKIKAKIEESELLIDNSQGCMSNEDLYKEFGKIEFGKSLLEKGVDI